MKIRYNGKYITVKTSEDREDMQYLECVCEHALADHEYHNLPFTKKDFETGHCRRCSCSQFKLTGRIETRRVGNYVQS